MRDVLPCAPNHLRRAYVSSLLLLAAALVGLIGASCTARATVTGEQREGRHNYEVPVGVVVWVG